MRLHTDTLTTDDVYRAAKTAGVRVLGARTHGSRTHARGLEVGLSGSGRHGGQWGNTDEPSATWDEWGVFLSELYRLDTYMRVGQVYQSSAHFHWVTGDRFADGKPSPMHVQHRWVSLGWVVTGTYRVQECKGNCGAVIRSPRNAEALAMILAN